MRIDDLDPGRTVAGAADEILRTLEIFALHWDDEVIYQSGRTAEYRAVADTLLRRGAAFRCTCSRRALREHIEDPELGPRYPGTCRQRRLTSPDTAIRVRVDAPEPVEIDDLIQGRISIDVGALVGDYVIYRRDRVPAYHLAVVVDDEAQGVTTVVRGSDLLRSTGVHLHLGGLLGYRPARYGHVPVLTHASGEKMSKQRGAAQIDTDRPQAVAAAILEGLGSRPPRALIGAPPAELWTWATEHWRPDELRGRLSIVAED